MTTTWFTEKKKWKCYLKGPFLICLELKWAFDVKKQKTKTKLILTKYLMQMFYDA